MASERYFAYGPRWLHRVSASGSAAYGDIEYNSARPVAMEVRGCSRVLHLPVNLGAGRWLNGLGTII